MQKSNNQLPFVSIVIPAYNVQKTAVSEVRNVLKLLRSLKLQFEIIVVDDNSTDQTYTFLEKNFKKTNSVRLLKNEKNRGIAQNIRYTYSRALGTYVLLYSIDGDWRYTDIKKLIHQMLKTQADIVIGKRQVKRGYTFKRNVVSFFYNFLPKLFFNVDTIDAGSIKIFKRSLLNQPYISKSVFFEAEIIIRAKCRGKKIISIPVHYSRKKTKNEQTINPILIFRSFIDLVRTRISL